MAISTVNVDFSAILQNAATATGLLRVRLSQVGTVEDSETGDTVILPIAWQETTLTDGAATLALVPNKIIEPSCTYYEIQLKSVPDCPKACAKLLLSGIMYVPDEDCNVLDLLISPPSPETANTASGYASQAKQAAQVAENFAIQAGDRYDDVAEAAATALTDIGTAKQDALDAIGTAQSGATEAISTAEDAALQAIGQARGTALDDIGTAQGTAIGAVQAEGNTQVGRVYDAGEDSVADVTAAQATAVSAVQAQQATSVAVVTAEGTRQTGLVTAEGTAQVNAVTQAGNGYVSTMQGLVSDAQAARDAAQTAQGLAEDAQTAAEGASTDAQGYAGDASTSAGQAAQSASDAAASATAAQTSAESIAASAEQIQTNERNITNIQALLNGTLYREETDSTAAYSKAVPTGAMPYASMDMIGGKTVVWNQLVTNGNFADSTAWYSGNGTLTIANNTATVTGTTSTYLGFSHALSPIPLIENHKYLITAVVSSSAGIVAILPFASYATGAQVFSGVTSPTRVAFIYTASQTGNAILENRCSVTTQGTSETVTATFQNYTVHDITMMFGAGNEPATVAEFESMFPSIDPAYNAGELRSAGVTEVVSKDPSDNTLGTLPIPAAIQALPGYGWSAGTAYNYVDFDRKVYVQNVGSVDLGTLNWAYLSSVQIFVGILSGLPQANNEIPSNVICSAYPTANVYWNSMPDKSIRTFTALATADRTDVIAKDSAYTDAAAFKAAMQGVMLYYELATPIETDISSLLTDSTIEVEPGGTLTFKNQHGDDWRVPVPNSETFLVQATPELPTTDGTYTLQCTVTDGTPSVTWVTA